jgi:putative choline sulfate-utilization transcription factor
MYRLMWRYVMGQKMATLHRNLPPLGSLVAFDAAARHLSITKAADELSLTQAAVSRKIRALEDDLGVALFRRLHRSLRLTADGERLHAAVSGSLWRIAETAESLREQSGPAQVSISATIAFATFWLMPRLPRFRAAYPDIELRLTAGDHRIDVESEGVDAAIRFGVGPWRGLASERLLEEEVFPVCSPGYLQRNPALQEAPDLRDHRLLHLDVAYRNWMDWAQWFRSFGLEAPPVKRGLRFNTYTILIQAATAGEGVALGWRNLVEEFIDAGPLVRPVDASLPATGGYHALWPESAEPTPELQSFLDWLRTEAAQAPTGT